MAQEISAGIIIYRKTPEGPKFLLLYNGGKYWNFPKGKLADGERSFQAAIREVYEETGFSSRDLHFREWFKVQDRFSFVRDKQKIDKTVVYYLAETRNAKVRIKIQPDNHRGERHEGYGWFLYKEAVRFISGPIMKNNLKNIYENLVQKKGLQSNRTYPARQGRNVRGYRPSNRQSSRSESSRKRA